MRLPFFTSKVRLPKVSLNPTIAKRRRGWWRPWMKWTAFGLGGIVVIFMLLGAYYYPKLRPAISEAQAAKQTAKNLSNHVTQQDFVKAKADAEQLQQHVATIKKSLASAQGLRAWPYIGRQYQAAVDLVNVGSSSVKAVNPLVEFMAHLFEPFAGKGKISLSSITPAEKGLLLGNIASREEDLKLAQDSIHEASVALEKIPEKGLVAPLRNIILPLKQQFPLITQALDQAIPATHLLPPILGYPKEKTYLFLLQNNTELRPAGGFIGTYGLMKVSSGEIVSLATDNSYNLDEVAKKLPVIQPPPAIKKYLKQNAWYFRDSNWSPDFPTSAEQALFFYQREGGQKNVDGVLAITPTTISALLRLVGAIKIDGDEFTADNFVDKLQAYVDKGYKQDGKTDSQRKDIIGLMTSELVDRLLKLPVSQWKDVFLVLSQQLNEKQMLMYMNDPVVQALLVDQNWGGAINRNEKIDSLMVVDANLASLKTDIVMQRAYDYKVNLDGDRPTATLTITYKHTGKFDWRTSWRISRYNTYVRVYVPNGAELVSSNGSQRQERSQAEGTVETTTELGKTVFSTFKSIEPGTESTLKLTYRLPASVKEQLSSEGYRMAWQKQAGMLTPTIHLNVEGFSSKPVSAEGLDNDARFSHSSLSFSGPLSQDRNIIIRQ